MQGSPLLHTQRSIRKFKISVFSFQHNIDHILKVPPLLGIVNTMATRQYAGGVEMSRIDIGLCFMCCPIEL